MKKLSKILSMILVLTMVLGIAAGCSGAGKDAEGAAAGKDGDAAKEGELKGSLVIWSFTDEPQKYQIPAFTAKYPKVKIDFTQYPFEEYIQKLKSVLSAGTGVPDIFYLEIGFLNQLIENPALEDLSKAPYEADNILAGQYEYVQKLSRDSKGVIKGITWQATPGGYWYRRDVAKQYLGTDDPEKIREMIKDWPSIMELGQKVYKESGGKVHLLSDVQDIVQIQKNATNKSWVVDGKFKIDPEIEKCYDLAKEAREKNVEAKLGQWSQGWSAAMAEGKAVLFALPTWGLQYVIMNNDKEGKGRWGFTKAPVDYYWGGTWASMYAKSKNKTAAWEFIKFITDNDEYLTDYVKKSGDFVSKVSITKALIDDYSNEFAGGQNLLKWYADVAQNVKVVNLTIYDHQINQVFGPTITNYLDGKTDKAGAIEQFKKDVKNACPDVTVE